MLKKLEAKGFIRRERSTEDERVLNVDLTEEGERLREKALSIPAKMRECFGLNDEECAALYKLVYKLLGNVAKCDKK